jgi:hypothetical protein
MEEVQTLEERPVVILIDDNRMLSSTIRATGTGHGHGEGTGSGWAPRRAFRRASMIVTTRTV